MTSERGLDYISGKQLKNGGFASRQLDVASRNKYRTTFIPSLIYLALTDVPGSERIKHDIVTFLLAQKNKAWSWNYWDRHARSARTHPYPDDLDDSFLAMSVLWHHDQELITPTVIARMSNLLFATEAQTGGPYKTWLVDESADKVWHDVDVVVNSNVGSFLSLLGVSLDGINELIDEAIEKGAFDSPYYPPLQPALYFLSKWYKGDESHTLQRLVLSAQQSGVWESPHQAALGISSLLRLGYPAYNLMDSINYLIETQQEDGSWPAGPICAENKVYFGASAMTTALCLEALALHRQARATQPPLVSKPGKRHYDAVVRELRSTIHKLPHADLQAHTLTILERIVAQDNDTQIVMLPWLVTRAAGVQVPEPLLHRLAVMSMWGWMAYTTYDDFLDNEGNPLLLPSAILANRQLIMTLTDIMPDNQEFQSEVKDIMNRLDGANAWEVTHCRGTVKDGCISIATLPDYGDYWQLAERSLGHTISGLGVLYAADLAYDGEVIAGLRDFFKQYLIARQLNDDAHDWEEDLAAGHINAVAALILRRWKPEGPYEVDLEKDSEALRIIMWENAIEDVHQLILEHTKYAREALVHIRAEPLLALLTPLEASAKKALEERDKALEFMQSL